MVAVLIVALAASTASYILWHQSLWVRQIENLTLRAQGDTLTRAAIQWAAAILADDNAAVDHLGEAWARLIPAFAAESAQLAGAIADEQAKLNVNNLARGGGPSTREVLAFQRLFASLGISVALTEALIDWLDEDDEVTQPNGAEDQYYLALDPPYRAANRRVVDLGELAAGQGVYRRDCRPARALRHRAAGRDGGERQHRIRAGAAGGNPIAFGERSGADRRAAHPEAVHESRRLPARSSRADRRRKSTHRST